MTIIKFPTMTNDEPMPTTNSESRPVQPEAIKRFTETFMAQWEKGKAKYGSDLMTHNGRKPLVDALQEACDNVAYIVQAMMEMEDKDAEIARLKQQLRIALEAANGN